MGDSQEDCEKLFLLEVLVNNLSISHSSLNLDKKLVSDLADTCVVFQFLHYPPLVVCESDFIGTLLDRLDSSHITFKSGKSCLFSLRLPRGPVLPVPFEIMVSVVRRLKKGILPDKLDIGKTRIDLSEHFTELLNQNIGENCDAIPLSRIKKGNFEIKNDNGVNVGNLTAFVRVSCFGKLIITQFSSNKEDENSYLFKGTDMSKFLPTVGDKTLPCYDKSSPRVSTELYKQEPMAMGDTDICKDMKKDPPAEMIKRDFRFKEYEPLPTRIRDDYSGKSYPEERPCGCPMDYAYRPEPRFPPPAPPKFPIPTYLPKQSVGERYGPAVLCDCPYPVPPSVLSKYSQRTKKPSELTTKTKKPLELTPGEVCLDEDRVIFQLPLKKHGDPITQKDKVTDSSIYYKLTSAEETEDGQQKNTVHIKSDDLPSMVERSAVSPISGLPVDDRHDVFLFKIGKRCDGEKKKNLELELRTPKLKEPKPCTTDQNTQYLESDVKPVRISSAKKKKSKSGKGKGGKGKKK